VADDTQPVTDMCKDRRYYTDANRAAWDEVAPLHAERKAR